MGGGVMFPHHTEFRSALLMLMLDAKHQSDTCMTRELARASFFFSAKGQYQCIVKEPGWGFGRGGISELLPLVLTYQP